MVFVGVDSLSTLRATATVGAPFLSVSWQHRREAGPLPSKCSKIPKNLQKSSFHSLPCSFPSDRSRSTNLDTLLSSTMTLTLGGKLPRRLLQLRLARPAACVLASSSPLLTSFFSVVSCLVALCNLISVGNRGRAWRELGGVPSSSREKQTHCVAGTAGTWVKAWGLRGGDNIHPRSRVAGRSFLRAAVLRACVE